jgi:glycosyltransferase involved in cell wall biosynthesis
MITVILNCYKRPEYLQEQITSIREQTIPAEDILIWYNKPENEVQFDLSGLGCKVAMCNYNFKFHGRFAYGLLAKTKYVAYFDDDTIPGKKWFENCLHTIESGYDGILGSAGVKLLGDGYNPHKKIGWNGGGNEVIEEVDLVGHAWFFQRKYLSYLWDFDPISWDNGEDIQLSAFSKIKNNIKTYVPPHPVNNIEMWGSKKGNVYGNDSNASYKLNTHNTLRDHIVIKSKELGWKTVN